MSQDLEAVLFVEEPAGEVIASVKEQVVNLVADVLVVQLVVQLVRDDRDVEWEPAKCAGMMIAATKYSVSILVSRGLCSIQ